MTTAGHRLRLDHHDQRAAAGAPRAGQRRECRFIPLHARHGLRRRRRHARAACLHRHRRSGSPAARWSSSACAAPDDGLCTRRSRPAARRARPPPGIASGHAHRRLRSRPGAIVHAVLQRPSAIARELDADPGDPPYTPRLPLARSSASIALRTPRLAELEPALPSSCTRASHFRAGKGAHLLPRMGHACAARRNCANPGDARRASTCSARASWCCAIATGQLRAHYNVCRHRGARLCRASDEPVAAGRGDARRGHHGRTADRMPLSPVVLRLQRRAWSRAPHLRSVSGFDSATVPVCTRSAVDSWGGFVFLNLDRRPKRTPLATQLGGIPDRAAALSAGAIAHRRTPFATRSCGELENHL